MKWFKFETEDQRYKEHEPEGMLVYLGPEALKHAIVVNDFEVFQSSPECVPGGSYSKSAGSSVTVCDRLRIWLKNHWSSMEKQRQNR